MGPGPSGKGGPGAQPSLAAAPPDAPPSWIRSRSGSRPAGGNQLEPDSRRGAHRVVSHGKRSGTTQSGDVEPSRPGPPGFAERPESGRIRAPDAQGQAESAEDWGSDEELHRLWLEATADSIGADVRRVGEMLESALPQDRPLLVYWLEAFQQLEHWLRHR